MLAHLIRPTSHADQISSAHPAVMPHVLVRTANTRANSSISPPVQQPVHLPPSGVRLYSTCGGTTGYAIRLENHPSNACNDCASIFHSPHRFCAQVAKAMSTARHQSTPFGTAGDVFQHLARRHCSAKITSFMLRQANLTHFILTFCTYLLSKFRC